MSRRTGLVIFAILSLVDTADLALTDGKHPPLSVAIAGAVLGLASLVLVVIAWRGRRWALAPLVVLRVLSALSALPAFVVGGVPAPMIALAAGIVGLTVLGVALVAHPAQAAGLAA